MQILVDENIPLMTVRMLRQMGHDVRDIRRTPDEGIPDDTLWEIIQRERRLLITTDKGFASKRDTPHDGILIIPLHQPNRYRIHQRVMQAIAQFTPEEWSGLLVIMRDRVQSIYRLSTRK